MIYLLLAIVMLAIGLAYWFGLRASRRSRSVSALLNQMQPLDLSLFRNLFDHSQDGWLAARLPADDFRAYRIQRRKVMLLYLVVLRGNFALLLRAAQMVERSGSLSVREHGLEVSNASLTASLRITVMIWKVRLHLDSAGRAYPRELLELYESLQDALVPAHRPFQVVAAGIS